MPCQLHSTMVSLFLLSTELAENGDVFRCKETTFGGRDFTMAQKEETVILPRSKTEMVHVALSEFRGKFGIDIRIYFITESGEWRPTKRGVRIPIEQKDDLVAAIETVSELYVEEEQEEKAE